MPSPSELFSQVKPVALQAAFFGALFAGVHGLKKLVSTPLHPWVEDRPIVMNNVALRESLSQLAQVAPAQEMSLILDKCCVLLQLSDSIHNPKAQSEISRISIELETDIRSMLYSIDWTSSEEVFVKVTTCKEEVLPTIRSQFDDILHNHLLQRNTR